METEKDKSQHIFRVRNDGCTLGGVAHSRKERKEAQGFKATIANIVV